MLAWASLIFFISSQVAAGLLGQPKVAIYQSEEESARIASKTILVDQTISTPTPTETPSPTPTILASSTPTSTPTPTPKQTSSSEDYQSQMVTQINNFRASIGLTPVSINSETCSFAKTRAGEVSGGFNHDGFRQRLQSNTLPYPSFSSVAENIAMHYDYLQVVPGWINSPGHNENLRKDTPFGCVERNGDYYVYEAWRP